mmetsp:Transcript_2009/g.2536  ORF Transcript_2009/g.2536 Transcript_2009/m.2536 type:complete len:114 (+) Transcript_2009:358-699(+)
MFVVKNDNLDKLEEMARLYESLMISIDMQRELKDNVSTELESASFGINKEGQEFIKGLQESLKMFISKLKQLKPPSMSFYSKSKESTHFDEWINYAGNQINLLSNKAFLNKIF